MYTVEAIRWTPEGVVILDQLRLPREVTYHTYTDYHDVAKAIKDMIIRGAPAIGVAAAMGVALGVEHSRCANSPRAARRIRHHLRHPCPHPSNSSRSVLGHQSLQSPFRGIGDGHRIR